MARRALRFLPPSLRRVAPGVALCTVTAGAAVLGAAAEARAFGHSWLEPLVLAILAGAGIRCLWAPPPRFLPGIDISAKLLLEIAVALLGASVSAQALRGAGPALLLAVVATVLAALAAGYAICRVLGLRHRLALLIACGNAICGNSAIAAVAPVIGAAAEDVAASIAFTALLGVAVVLALPVASACLGLTAAGSGIFAGLTVYAVPQVLAAAAPMGGAALHIGTLVKLMRVLMLGPVMLGVSVLAGRGAAPGGAPPRMRLHRIFPWFIAVFLSLMLLRSGGFLPAPLRAACGQVATALTVISMAALGLQVDAAAIRGVGPRAVAAVIASLAALCGLALLALCVLHPA